jgi:hypothetical protein
MVVHTQNTQSEQGHEQLESYDEAGPVARWARGRWVGRDLEDSLTCLFAACADEGVDLIRFLRKLLLAQTLLRSLTIATTHATTMSKTAMAYHRGA